MKAKFNNHENNKSNNNGNNGDDIHRNIIGEIELNLLSASIFVFSKVS